MTKSQLKKILTSAAFIVVIFTFLSVYGHLVIVFTNHNNTGNLFYRAFNSYILFPKKVHEVLISNEWKGIPPTYIKRDTSFKQINKLTYDLYGLRSHYVNKLDRWQVDLFNFKNDSILHVWKLEKEDFNFTRRQYENAAPNSPILLEDRSLLLFCGNTFNLFRLDDRSQILWHNKSRNFHHSMNLANDGNIWVCTSNIRGIRDNRYSGVKSYKDDFITKISVESGEVIYEKSISQILIENGYKNFIYGVHHDGFSRGTIDPLHLNDIEPALYDSQYWKKGDLFISLRNISVILVYRPIDNKIVHLLYGPFLNQHDVDILSPEEISIFNNNVTTTGQKVPFSREFETPTIYQDSFYNSEILIYDFTDSSYKQYVPNHFEDERIQTRSQGLSEILNNGDVYVESQNNGKVYILNDEEVVLAKQFDAPIKNMIHRPHWIRIYENVKF